jgi:hypothetical protein
MAADYEILQSTCMSTEIPSLTGWTGRLKSSELI